jgi:hypothetical protein
MAAGQVIYTPQHIILNPVLGEGASTPDAAPSSAIMGYALGDPRAPFNPGSGKAGIQAFVSTGRIKSVAFNPATASTTNIAAAAHVVSGTAMTLVSSTGAGITVLTTPFYCEPSGITIPTGTLCIDGLPSYTTFGTGFVSSYYNPSGMIARAIAVTAAASATGGVFTVKGADVYGYPMSQTITAVANSTVNGLKAFKFIYSVTPGVTDSSHNYSIGTADVYGLPFVANQFCDVFFYFNNIIGLFATYVAPDTTSPATAATGDVRGTLAVTADGTKRLEVFSSITLGMLSNVTGGLTVGLFGQPQV